MGAPLSLSRTTGEPLFPGFLPSKGGQIEIVVRRQEDIDACIGYLGHPFVKEAPWAFTARLFFVVKGILAIEIAGKSFS